MVSISSSPRISISPFVSHPSILKSLLYTALAVLVLVIGFHTLGTIPMLLAFVSLLFHEYGHYWTSNRFNVPVEVITFSLFGGSVTREHSAARPIYDAIISASGPVFGLLPLLVVYPIAFFTNTPAFTETVALIGIINLVQYVPYGSFDGAEIRDHLATVLSGTRFIPSLAHRPITWVIAIVQIGAVAGASFALVAALTLL